MGDNTEVLNKLDEILSKIDNEPQITDWSHVDTNITNFGTYYLSSYIQGDHIIKGVGMISREYAGWFGFSLSFTDTTFSVNQTSPEYGSINNCTIRIWYV